MAAEVDPRVLQKGSCHSMSLIRYMQTQMQWRQASLWSAEELWISFLRSYS